MIPTAAAVARSLTRRCLQATCSRLNQPKIVRCFSAATSPEIGYDPKEGLPDSIRRVGEAYQFPNEYPGQIYAFNWCLNGDGVTPLKKSSWRLMKPFDLKVAGLPSPKIYPLKVTPSPSLEMPEAGSDGLSFDKFDQMNQRTKDWLSLSDHIYCPEGYLPGTRTLCRIISNSARLAPDLVAYLERAPKQDPPQNSQPITVYLLEQSDVEFAGYAIEEIEIEDEDTGVKEAKSVAAVVVSGQTIDIGLIVAGLELSQKGLAADEAERAARKAAAAEEAASK